MKKINLIFLSFLILFLNVNCVNAQDKIKVSLNKCVDGDTAWFNMNNKVIKARFLAINTKESTTKKEPYGKEASDFTCNALKSATKIELEYDKNSDKTDKYNRELVWVWIDDNLLQEQLLENGLAEIKYLYGDYEYTPHLQKVENTAKSKKINIWSDYEEDTNDDINILYFALGSIAIVILLLNNKNKKAKKLFNEIMKKRK